MYKKITGIYKITNLLDGRIYIGASVNILRRLNEHKNRAFKNYGHDKAFVLYKDIQRLGINSFSFEIQEECSEKELYKREIFWIEFYDCCNMEKGYNRQLGNRRVINIQKEDNHPNAKLSLADVVFCREQYAQGKQAKEIYKQFFQDKISFGGFERMWFGQTWKEVRSEVFQNNPRPRQKILLEQVALIKYLYQHGSTAAEIFHLYKRTISRTSINDIVNNRRYQDIKPNNQSDVETISLIGE